MTNDEVRRVRLDLLIEEFGGVRALADKLKRSASQVSQWRNASPDSKTGKPRGMGDAAARRLEDVCEKPIGWMDMPPEAALQRVSASAEPSAAQSEPLSPDEINARLAELEAVVRAGALQAGVPVEMVVGDLRGMRERVRATLASDAPQRSERDERGLGQPNPDVVLTLPSASAVNSSGVAERRHGPGRRRTN